MNYQKDAVSIVICCYNYGKYLGEAIESALKQTRKPEQIVIVDDGSTDNTKEVALAYADRGVEYFAMEHVGLCAARNFGLEQVRCEFVVFLDADDKLDPEFLELTLAEISRHDKGYVDFVYTQKEHFMNATDISSFPEFDVDLLKVRGYVMMTSLFRVEVVRKYGFDPAFHRGYEDYDLVMSIVGGGGKGRLLNRPLVKVRIHSASRTRMIGLFGAEQMLIRKIVRKHNHFFAGREKREALRAAANRQMVALAMARSSGTPFFERFRQTFAFALCSLTHPEFKWQLVYLFAPQRVVSIRD